MTIMQGPPGAETVIDGRRYLYFAGTGYLGLHGHSALVNAACDATRQYGLGSATTRAGYGNSPPTVEAERQAAHFFGSQDAFYFASGYVGNQLLVSGLQHQTDALFLDEHSHYSVVDATRMGGLPTYKFPHADATSLRQQLKEHLQPGARPLVFSDGVFAARGTIAPVADYCDVLRNFPGAALCLDDCHAVGVLGDQGRGTYEHAGVYERGVNISVAESGDDNSPQLYAVGTLSKAFGAHGGILWGSHRFLQQIKTESHWFEGASAPPVPAAAASAAALQLVSEHREIVQQVQHNARFLKNQLQRLGLELDSSPVPIICLTLDTAAHMQHIQQSLMNDGILIAFMRGYSGLGSQGALRIAVFATHTTEMLERLAQTIGRLL
jgi:7-keto-8-aminopelargonate synthetase-like enzyme